MYLSAQFFFCASLFFLSFLDNQNDTAQHVIQNSNATTITITTKIVITNNNKRNRERETRRDCRMVVRVINNDSNRSRCVKVPLIL